MALHAPGESAAATNAAPLTEIDRERQAIKEKVIEALRNIYDPEIPVNIYDLGLIYEVAVDAEKNVAIKMTLTAPACPSAQELPEQVRDAVMAVPGVADCEVETVWDPPWEPSRMSEEARLQLNMF